MIFILAITNYSAKSPVLASSSTITEQIFVVVFVNKFQFLWSRVELTQRIWLISSVWEWPMKNKFANGSAILFELVHTQLCWYHQQTTATMMHDIIMSPHHYEPTSCDIMWHVTLCLMVVFSITGHIVSSGSVQNMREESLFPEHLLLLTLAVSPFQSSL